MNDDETEIINRIEWGAFQQQLIDYVRLELAGGPVAEVYPGIAFAIETLYECSAAYYSELHRQAMRKPIAERQSAASQGRIEDVLQRILPANPTEIEIAANPRWYEKFIDYGANLIDRDALGAKVNSIRQVVEAILQSPLQNAPRLSEAVRGEILRYETPLIVINLSARKTVGKQRTWRLSGQVRTFDGQRLLDIERIILHQPEQPTFVAQQPTWTEGGTFVFEKLLAGKYSVTVLTSQEEIVIRKVIIGEDL